MMTTEEGRTWRKWNQSSKRNTGQIDGIQRSRDGQATGETNMRVFGAKSHVVFFLLEQAWCNIISHDANSATESFDDKCLDILFK